MRRSVTLMSISAACMTLFGAVRAEAACTNGKNYALIGAKWCKVTNGINLIPVRDHTPARWPVSSALSTWNYVTPVNYMHLYKVTSGQYADYWSGGYGHSWLGLTAWTTKNGCFLAGTDVYLNDTYQDEGYGWTDAITRHETGHLIGLDHPTDCNTLMWGTVPNCARSSAVTTCDATGAAVIY